MRRFKYAQIQWMYQIAAFGATKRAYIVHNEYDLSPLCHERSMQKL